MNENNKIFKCRDLVQGDLSYVYLTNMSIEGNDNESKV